MRRNQAYPGLWSDLRSLCRRSEQGHLMKNSKFTKQTYPFNQAAHDSCPSSIFQEAPSVAQGVF